MPHFKSIKLAIIFGFLALQFHARAEDVNIVGNGLGFASPSHALYENPAALVQEKSSHGVALDGLWLFDPSSPIVSASGQSGMIGLGADYRKSGTVNQYEGGLGLDFGMTKLGITLRTGNGATGFDGDVGAIFDLRLFRLIAVLRGLDAGPDRLDVGIGFGGHGPVTFEFDAKRPFPLSTTNTTLFDAGLGATSGAVSVSVGYDFSYVSNVYVDGGFHAGLGYAVTPKFSIDGYYRPWTQEITSSKWSAGARYTF